MEKEKMSKNKWFLNGGRGSGRTFRLLCEAYENKIAKLQSECRTCVYTDSPCVRSDYPCKDGVCSHYKNVFDENTELRLKLEALEGQTPWKDIKDKSEVIGKLTKATETIKKLMVFAEIDNREYEEAYKEAEQFLKETK
jgi:hypothetical protein